MVDCSSLSHAVLPGALGHVVSRAIKPPIGAVLMSCFRGPCHSGTSMGIAVSASISSVDHHCLLPPSSFCGLPTPNPKQPPARAVLVSRVQHHMAAEMIQTEGLQHSLFTYNALISGCASSRGYDRAMGYFSDMVSRPAIACLYKCHLNATAVPPFVQHCVLQCASPTGDAIFS